MVFDASAFREHERVTHVTDSETGLQAIIAVHDTTLGPSLGGTRLRDYESADDALRDVLRLSYAMTYKAAAADLDLGGGKAVIVGNPDMKGPELMRAYGRAINSLNGSYITSVDVNTGVDDMDVIAEETDYVTGTSEGLGDPSPITADGVYHSMRACAKQLYGDPDLSNRHVAVQGVGKVGSHLVQILADAGASVTIADPNEETVTTYVEEYGVESVPPADIYDVSCDIFAPCAFGGAINDETIPRLDCDIVAGAANNMLAHEDRHAVALHERDIVYAPDYVANAGGLITVAKEYLGGTRDEAKEEAAAIGDRLEEILDRAAADGITPLDATQRYVEHRLKQGKRANANPTND